MKIRKEITKQDLYYNVYKTIASVKQWNVPDLYIKIFGRLLHEYNELSIRYSDEVTNQLFLNKDMKDKLVLELDTTYNSFMNALTKLKKVGLLNKDMTINPKYIFRVNKVLNLTIQFEINETTTG